MIVYGKPGDKVPTTDWLPENYSYIDGTPDLTFEAKKQETTIYVGEHKLGEGIHTQTIIRHDGGVSTTAPDDTEQPTDNTKPADNTDKGIVDVSKVNGHHNPEADKSTTPTTKSNANNVANDDVQTGVKANTGLLAGLAMLFASIGILGFRKRKN